MNVYFADSGKGFWLCVLKEIMPLFLQLDEARLVIDVYP